MLSTTRLSGTAHDHLSGRRGAFLDDFQGQSQTHCFGIHDEQIQGGLVRLEISREVRTEQCLAKASIQQNSGPLDSPIWVS